MTRVLSILFSLLFTFSVVAADYPASWWEPFPRDQASSWEILPQDAKEGEVILSKRRELGVFSNLGAARFEFDGGHYGSVEGLWQLMKYPDPMDLNDPRHEIEYPYTRAQVAMMSMWESKEAGDLANDLMKEHDIKFISYKGRRFWYKDMADGSAYHYELIYGATLQKVLQNDHIKKLLLQTRGLILKPDHKVKDSKPASYFYFKMLMKIRDGLLQ